MDVQLQELIDKIKSEGIKTAEQESARVLRDAEHKANDIIAKAHDEASAIIAKANDEGLFVAALPERKQPFTYRLRMTTAAGETEIEDPYRFPAVLSDKDAKQLAAGQHLTSYQVLGAASPESAGNFTVLVTDTGGDEFTVLNNPSETYFLVLTKGSGGVGPG